MPSAKARYIEHGLNSDAERAKLDLLLTSGGDGRLLLDPVTRRSRYGTLPHPAPEEIRFSSSTASTISPRGYLAARDALARISGNATRGENLEIWFDELREKVVTLVGVPGAQAILSASGTEAEMLALTLARALLRRPLTNIVIARDETGTGVMQAAAGTHFDCSAPWQASVVKGLPLAGLEDAVVETARIEIRDSSGRLLPLETVDANVGARVQVALDRGSDVLLHVLDASKTGRSGPSRKAARVIARSAPGRVIVVVDACQLRCSFEEIKADLDAGFFVMITGSKFAGGPPFCGALLIPPSRVEELRDLRAPTGLAAYSARCDWPALLRGALDDASFPAANLGLGLRWQAALAEIEAFGSIAPATKRAVTLAFGEAVRAFVAARPHMELLDSVANTERPPTIFPIVTGAGASEKTNEIYQALRSPLAQDARDSVWRICHVGQPVVVANRAALRLCLSMPLVSLVAERLQEGMTIDAALAPVKEDLQALFDKWDLIAATMG